jgi:hypothetical protein
MDVFLIATVVVPMPDHATCQAAMAMLREELSARRAECGALVEIERKTPSPFDDTCRPCIEKHRWEQGQRDTPPW